MRARNVAENDRRLDAARTIALHSTVFGEGKPGKLFAEILHHVIALELAVNRHVEVNFLLPADALGSFLFEKQFVVGC